MKLLLIRHGQTHWNFTRRFQGHSDIFLNENGIQQAVALGERLASRRIDAVYASDLQRAHETARLVAQRHACEVRADPRLRELNFGAWEGLTYEEIKAGYPALIADWETGRHETAPPDGETLTQLAARAKPALDEIRAKHADQTVLLVAHGGTLQALFCLALDVPISKYWQFRFSHASFTEIAFYPHGAIVNVLNDTSHLENS